MINNLLSRSFLTVMLVLFALASAIGQAKTVTGTVTDAEENSPLPGVSILVKGTTTGTVTGLDGTYSVEVSENATLVFSFVGYETQEVQVGSRSTIDISMGVDLVALEEIVVIGYGTQKKEDLTGSVTAVGAKDFNKGVISSPQELLMGRTSGVQITTNSGAPGTGSTIRIRGGSSLTASNNPLIVIDGVPADPGGISGMRNPLNGINPNDIETFTVLKDASATAIYGSRASNGVIIITTKRGDNSDKPKFSYNGSFTLNTLPSQLDVLTGDEYRAEVSVRIQDGTLPTGIDAGLGTANTDWQSEVLQSSTSMDHNLSMSGALLDIPVRASIGYTNQNGILRTSSMERMTLSLGLDPTFANDDVKMKINFKGTNVNNRFANWGAISSAVTFDPTQPVTISDNTFGGYFFWEQQSTPGAPITIAPSNPVALLELNNNTSSVLGMVGNIETTYTLPMIPELSATLNLATQRSSSEGTNITEKTASWAYDPTNGNGIYGVYDQSKQMDLLDFYLNYTKEMGDHNLAIMAGYSWQHFFGKGSSLTQNFDQNYDITPYDEGQGENFLVSFFGRANYSFQDKYLLTATLRRDGSSRFSEENRWGVFPSAAFAWRVNEESFLSGVDAISDLKFRIGYGITGQQEGIGNYTYLPAVNFGNERARYQFGNTYYDIIRFQAFDATLKWEETSTFNVGVDFGFLADRINGSVEYYKRTTKDLLNFVPIPIGTNFSNFLTTNIGTMNIDGIELNIDARVIESPDFSWDFGMNLTTNTNEITKLTLVDDPNYLGVLTGGIGGGVGTTIQVHSVGFPRNTFFVHEQVYDESGMPIEGLYVDQNLDGIINDEDRIRYENPAPTAFMGFSSRFNYKDFDLSLNARLNVGNYIYDNVSSQYANYNNVYNSVGYTNNIAATISQTNFFAPQYLSNFYLYDASFFRMDNISLGYYVGNRLSDSFDLALRATVQNAFVITKYEGLDPESASGIDNNIYPRPRTFLFGLSVNF